MFGQKRWKGSVELEYGRLEWQTGVWASSCRQVSARTPSFSPLILGNYCPVHLNGNCDFSLCHELCDIGKLFSLSILLTSCNIGNSIFIHLSF